MTYDGLLDALEQWHAANRDALARRGLRSGFRRSGPEALGDKPVAQLDLDGVGRLGSLVLWNTGEAELNVIDTGGRDTLVEHRVVADEDALERAVATLMSAVGKGAAGTS